MHIHGGDIYSREVRYDFSANLNFLGIPQSVLEAAYEGVRKSDHYPDVNCTQLKEAISQKEHVPVHQILCGNGAADLIFAFALAEKPHTAVICAPTFAEYEQALDTVDCEVRKVYLSKGNGFAYTDQILEFLTEDVDLVVLCNPNNPTGQILEMGLLRDILVRCQKFHIRLLLDECFVDFLDDAEERTALGMLEEYPELMVLRAFTKIYAMAGLRLGYAMTADEDLKSRMERVRQPWNVSIPAQMAGVAAVKEVEYVTHFRELLKEERKYLQDSLTEIGVQWYGSAANYIFFESIQGLPEMLLQEGIAIRDCSNYEGLEAGYYRIAVRSHEENIVLIQAMKKCLKEIQEDE